MTHYVHPGPLTEKQAKDLERRKRRSRKDSSYTNYDFAPRAERREDGTWAVRTIWAGEAYT